MIAITKLSSARAWVVAALAVIVVGLPPLAAQAQDSGPTSSCFDSCHAGAMEMLEDGYPLWAAKVGYKGCMQISCGYDMDG